MPQGIVKIFNLDKGYGFIAPDDGTTDVVVHMSQVERAGISCLVPGQRVTFDVWPDRRSGKSRAVNLREAQ
jgi:CspA family cold shock protein